MVAAARRYEAAQGCFPEVVEVVAVAVVPPIARRGSVILVTVVVMIFAEVLTAQFNTI